MNVVYMIVFGID